MSDSYTIRLDGCDDSTTMTVILSDEQYEVVKMISELSEEKSDHGCMPTMEVYKNKGSGDE